MAIDHVAHLTATVNEGPRRNRSICRTFVRFLCSNIGLLIIAIAYCVGGAFLFNLLEQYIELQNCQKGNRKSKSQKERERERKKPFSSIFFNSKFWKMFRFRTFPNRFTITSRLLMIMRRQFILKSNRIYRILPTKFMIVAVYIVTLVKNVKRHPIGNFLQLYFSLFRLLLPSVLVTSHRQLGKDVVRVAIVDKVRIF